MLSGVADGPAWCTDLLGVRSANKLSLQICTSLLLSTQIRAPTEVANMHLAGAERIRCDEKNVEALLNTHKQ